MVACDCSSLVHQLLSVVFVSFTQVSYSLTEIVSQSQVLEARQLFVYSFYRDVQIFHYRMPPEVLYATWNFSANETQGCLPKTVSLFLQYSSYPVISPDNSSYPPHFYIKRAALHSLTMLSDSIPSTLNMTKPAPGDWFLVAFLQDKSDRIQQKGLFVTCSTFLTSSLIFHKETNVIHLLPGVALSQQIDEAEYYKFYVPSNTWSVTVTLKQCSEIPTLAHVECPLIMVAKPLSLPNPDSAAMSVNCSNTYHRGQCVLEYVPYEDAWHYVVLEPVNSKMEFQISVETTACENGATPAQYMVLSELKFSNVSTLGSNTSAVLKVPNAAKRILVPLPFTPKVKVSVPTSPVCWPQVSLVRKTFPGNFLFEYTQEAKENKSVLPARLDVNNSIATILAFPIQPILDIGGTLTFELGIDISVNTSMQNVSVTACIDKGIRPVVTTSANCSSGFEIQVNTSSIGGRASLVMIPYPEPGNWYITLKTRCYHCNNSIHNTSQANIAHCEANATAVLFSIMSGSCVYGGCGPYGRCYQYISGGFIFSTCVCTAGWRGWGCTDGSQALSDNELLLATLLLSLSNLLFIPAIAIAIYRKYYTESLVYFFTMFFSTFYHACDEEAYTFCLMRLSVMQFCDFYSAILSFWVTIVAMADLPNNMTSLCHMAGALGIAVGVEYDRTGLWVFVVPAATGVIIMLISWICHCYKLQACFPRKTVWLLCLLPGILLSTTGLVCFAFLETRDNYKYVHSAWHGAMALAVLFLLPPRHDHKGTEAVENLKNDLIWGFKL